MKLFPYKYFKYFFLDYLTAFDDILKNEYESFDMYLGDNLPFLKNKKMDDYLNLQRWTPFQKGKISWI